MTVKSNLLRECARGVQAMLLGALALGVLLALGAGAILGVQSVLERYGPAGVFVPASLLMGLAMAAYGRLTDGERAAGTVWRTRAAALGVLALGALSLGAGVLALRALLAVAIVAAQAEGWSDLAALWSDDPASALRLSVLTGAVVMALAFTCEQSARMLHVLRLACAQSWRESRARRLQAQVVRERAAARSVKNVKNPKGTADQQATAHAPGSRGVMLASARSTS